MLPVLLSSNSESCFYALLLPTPYLWQWIPAATAEPDTSLENRSCVSWACPAMHRQESAGRPHWENYSSLFPSNYIHFLTLHCLRFSTATDHTSALCFWTSEAVPSKQSKAAQCSARTSAKEVYWNQHRNSPLWIPKSFLILVWDGEHWRLLEDCCWGITL